jgi:hypothetical protein
VTGRLFYPGTPVSTVNQTYHHDIAEILLKVALKTKTLIHIQLISCRSLFVLWSFFFWPFYCLSCFDWRLTTLVSLDFSCIWFAILYCIFDSDSQRCVITFVLIILWGFFSLAPLFGQHTNLRSHYLGWVEIRLFNNISVISWWSVLFADEINNKVSGIRRVAGCNET